MAGGAVLAHVSSPLMVKLSAVKTAAIDGGESSRFAALGRLGSVPASIRLHTLPWLACILADHGSEGGSSPHLFLPFLPGGHWGEALLLTGELWLQISTHRSSRIAAFEGNDLSDACRRGNEVWLSWCSRLRVIVFCHRI